MGQKQFKRLRKAARQMVDWRNSPDAPPEMRLPGIVPPLFQDGKGKAVHNPATKKGTYRWLKKNAEVAKKKFGK